MINNDNNTNLGNESLKNNISNNNSAFGFKSLNSNIDGWKNTAIGSNTLENNLDGKNNTAIGFDSLKVTNGKSNTAVGSFSGTTLKEGNQNILIGRSCDVSSEDAINEIVIGSYSTGHGDHKMVLGNSNIYAIEPSKDKKTNLGSSEYKFKNVHISGNIYKNGSEVSFGGGSTDFLSLTDTPSSYTASKFVKVNAAGTALEFVSSSGGGATELNDLSDVTVSSNQITFGDADTTAILPADDNGVDLGSSAKSFKDAYIGNDVKLLSDSAVLSLGADSDFVITHDGTTGATIFGDPVHIRNRTSAGNISGAISLITNQGTNETIVITNSQGQSNNAIAITATNGGITMDSTTLSIDSTDTTNITMTAVSASNKTLTISATNSGSGTGIIDIDADGAVTIDSNDGTNGIKLGTASSVPITIGNTTSEVEVADNLTVTGTTALNDDVTIATGKDILMQGSGTLTVGTGATSLGGTLSVTGTTALTGQLTLGDSGASTEYTLPTSRGSDGQVLQTNGSGVLSFVTPTINNFSDALVEGSGSTGSIYIGNDPSSNTGYSTSLTNTNGNVAIGLTALDAITTGYYNTAVGQDALTNNNTGFKNTAVGYYALKDNNGANNENTAVGCGALENVVQAGNTALGVNAGSNLTAGWNNVFIGKNAQPSANNGQNQIVIGYNATGQGNDSVTLGNADVTAVYMSQDGDATIYANTTIQSSDKRLKEDIEETKLGLDFINKLKPVSYKYIKKTEDQEQKTHEGLIAQEVEIVINEFGLTKDNHSLVHYDKSDDKYRLAYTELIGPLIKSIQELSKSNSELIERVKELENKLENK